MKKSFLLFYLLCMILVCVSPTVSATDSINVDSANKLSLFSSPDIARYVDDTDRLTIQDILKNDTLSFTSGVGVGETQAKHTLWLRFSLITDQAFVEKWLELLPNYLEHIDIYLVRDGKVYQQDKTGITVPFHEKTFNYNHPLFKILLTKQEKITVYLRVVTNLVAVQDMTLWTPSHFLKHEMVFLTIKAAVLGMYIFMIIASLWFELVIKNGVYRAFALYVGSCLFLNLMTIGWWYEMFNIASVSLLLIALMWTVPCGIVFCLKFAKAEMMKPKATKWAIKSFMGYGYLMTALFLMLPSQSKLLSNIDNVTTLLFIVISLYLIWKPIFKGDSDVRYVFMTLMLMLGVSIVLVTLELLGVIGHSDVIRQLPFTISTIFFVMIFYFLAKQYKKLQEERDGAILEILTMSQNAEQELMRQVQEKTKNIVNANIEIEKILKSERQAYQDKNNFIAMVSHEFKTPLTVIAATVQNLLRMIKNDVASQKLKKIQLSVNRLDALMNEYLSQDRLNLLNQSIEKKWIDIHSLIDDAADVAQLLSPDHHITCQYAIDDQLLWLDPDLFKLVIHTLIENAVKYTPRGTDIHIAVSKVNNYWQIDVIDNGPGLSAIDKEKIFDKNYRASTSFNQSGTGMGLSLARYLMQMQGGDLILCDTEHGGCWFKMILMMPEQQPETL